MALPSITTVVSVLFLAYMFNSIWSIGKLYFPPNCDDSKTVSIYWFLKISQRKLYRNITRILQTELVAIYHFIGMPAKYLGRATGTKTSLPNDRKQ